MPILGDLDVKNRCNCDSPRLKNKDNLNRLADSPLRLYGQVSTLLIDCVFTVPRCAWALVASNTFEFSSKAHPRLARSQSGDLLGSSLEHLERFAPSETDPGLTLALTVGNVDGVRPT